MDATLQSVFKLGYKRYKEHHGVSRDQHRAANAIMTCRSPEIGYEEWICQHDGHIEQQARRCWPIAESFTRQSLTQYETGLNRGSLLTNAAARFLIE